MTRFRSLKNASSFAQAEEDILALWQELDAFPRSVERHPKDDPKHTYVFYDGPPFATGLPHYGHLVASTLKDVIPRYWTMRGMRVERRFGWDTHGLPIEMEMEKALDLSGPKSIREYGVDKFNEACRSNVLRYTEEWRRSVTRLGRWVDFDNDYKTMDLSFMESVWWVFQQLFEKGLVYEGVRVMPYSWRLSTALSNFEANLDYRDVDDPAITVSMPLDNDPDDASLLVWTTTPWTLPSNLAVAVGEDLEYVRARKKGEGDVYIVAKALWKETLGDDAEVLATFHGKELLGKKYRQLFDYFADRRETQDAFKVIPSAHVTTESGTGLVHMAPAYGEDDFAACQKVGIDPVDPVDEEGRFTNAVADFAGRQVKEADKDIIRALKDKGRLYKQATIHHSYPFCWRSGTPLIYKTFPVWFVRVEDMRERMVKHNQTIHWVPEAVGQKRFGNWLAEARDWAISRNRFWGTPIPLWRCDKDTSHVVCLKSAEELEEKSGAKVDDLHPHKIDHLTFQCASCDGVMKRVPEVFDCWFESGSMPYAQVHYPFENQAAFEKGFPAEFIAEGLDQTRGWFYTLLVLSTALFDKAPFKNCIVNGLVLAEDGSKMSKSKRNYPDPMKLLEEMGADALRAYLIDSPVVRAEPLRFSESGVREVVRTVLLPLTNAWSFFVQYANIDDWDPKEGVANAPPVSERPELDRWILSVLQSLVDDVNSEMEGYFLYRVVKPMVGFIDDLTNWYIRKSRRRFWRSADDEGAQKDKAAAYATLYEVLVTFSKVIAPVMPFLTERIYQNLVREPGMQQGDEDSVHLCSYPLVDEARIDRALEQKMEVVRQVVGMGRALREKHKLKTRQPLKSVTIVTHDQAAQLALQEHEELLQDELNVRASAVLSDDAALCDVSFKANFKNLGKRLGKKMKEAADRISQLSREEWSTLEGGGAISVVGETITAEDVLVTRTAKGDVVLESQGALTVALDTALDDDLVREGLMREVVSRLQKIRKESGLDVTDRVKLELAAGDEQLRQALQEHQRRIAEEVLATQLDVVAPFGEPMDVDGHALSVKLEKA